MHVLRLVLIGPAKLIPYPPLDDAIAQEDDVRLSERRLAVGVVILGELDVEFVSVGPRLVAVSGCRLEWVGALAGGGVGLEAPLLDVRQAHIAPFGDLAIGKG